MKKKNAFLKNEKLCRFEKQFNFLVHNHFHSFFTLTCRNRIKMSFQANFVKSENAKFAEIIYFQGLNSILKSV